MFQMFDIQGARHCINVDDIVIAQRNPRGAGTHLFVDGTNLPPCMDEWEDVKKDLLATGKFLDVTIKEIDRIVNKKHIRFIAELAEGSEMHLAGSRKLVIDEDILAVSLKVADEKKPAAKKKTKKKAKAATTDNLGVESEAEVDEAFEKASQ